MRVNRFPIPRNIKILTLGFALIFLGFNGAQQYVTVFFSGLGNPEAGFQSLILIYLFFILANPLAAVILSKYGAKLAVVVSPLAYGLYIFSLATGQIFFVYLTSALLGAAAAVLWAGQTDYLIKSGAKEEKGRTAGYFNTLVFLGSAIGVIIIGFLGLWFSLRTAFFLVGFFPILGFLLLMFFLPRIEAVKAENQFALVGKAIKSATGIRVSLTWFTLSFVGGLVTGIIPIQIETNLSLEYIGILTSLFSICPIIVSYITGVISDSIGQKKIIMATYALILAGLFLLIFSSSSGLAFLILGIILLALGFTAGQVSFYSYTGEISNQNNLGALTALFWMARGAGLIFAPVLGRFLSQRIELLYIIAIVIAFCSLALIYPILKFRVDELKVRITKEIA